METVLQNASDLLQLNSGVVSHLTTMGGKKVRLTVALDANLGYVSHVEGSNTLALVFNTVKPIIGGYAL